MAATPSTPPAAQPWPQLKWFPFSSRDTFQLTGSIPNPYFETIPTDASIAMASEVKTYFLAPNWEYPPDGLIQLGSIMADPTNPSSTLNSEALLPPNPRLYPDTKAGWEKTRAELFSVNVGIWATFLQIFGLGGDVSGNKSKDTTGVYKVQTLETKYFVPSKKYLWECMQDENVKDYISNTWFKKSVFMVTGTKIARGFSVETRRVTENGGDGNVGVDLTGAGVPLQVGPKVNVVWKKTDNTGFTGSSDCVFAYQVVKIRSKRNDKFLAEDHNSGALLNNDVEKGEHGIEEFEADWEVEEASGAPEEATDTEERPSRGVQQIGGRGVCTSS